MPPPVLTDTVLSDPACAAADSISPAALLAGARERTLTLIADLQAGQWWGPCLETLNPPLWETGHIGWFEEFWCLRSGSFDHPSRMPEADALYDSARIAHGERWRLPLPDIERTLAFLREVRSSTLERLDKHDNLDYFGRLCAMHEEMHNEALTYTRQTLGYSAPATPAVVPAANTETCVGDVLVDGGIFRMGAEADGCFVFDNEKWAHLVEVRPFRMSRTPVTNAQFAEFVEAGGYGEQRWWDRTGWAWRMKAAVDHPVYWKRNGSNWQQRRYDGYENLNDDEPVCHVNWFEASAWCRWAGRRLPTEAEWEFAASTAPGDRGMKRRYPWGDQAATPVHANLYGTANRVVPAGAFSAGDSAWGLRQMMGNVWEWTADWFQPYPGFLRDPYAEYSEPWFGNHKVLRGGCHATRNTLIRNTCRNFYTPERNDVFAGFRTCAL